MADYFEVFSTIFALFSVILLANYATMNIQKTISSLKAWLSSLSFRTGVVVLVMCIPFYILSFAQMALPISVELKGVLWFVLFGLAKTCQYGGLTILGVEGVKRLKAWYKKKK